MIVDILLRCVWYALASGVLIVGETVKMGGSVGLVG